jgi:hypothetical protein
MHLLTLYVSTSGSDGFSGFSPQADGRNGPLRSICGALDRIRLLRTDGLLKTGEADILVEPGIYENITPIRFESSDLGNPDFCIRIRRNGEGQARFVAGKRLTGWEPHEGNILKMDLGRHGYRDLVVRELFINGTRMRKARWPKYREDNPYGAGWLFVPGKQVNFHKSGMGHPTEFRCDDLRPTRWKHIEKAEIFIFPRWNWSSDMVPVKSYDSATGKVTLARPCVEPIHPTDRYYFQNIFEELTDPGEWYFDRHERMLYFIPPQGTEPEDMVLTVPMADFVFTFEGPPFPEENLFSNKIDVVDPGGSMTVPMGWNMEPVGFITLEHLVLECVNVSAVLIRHAHNISLVGCTVRGTGGHGIVALKGRNNRIAGCDIYDTGCMGIYISGGYRSPHAGFYRDSGHEVENNYIHHVGRNVRSASAIDANGVGIRIAHNLIHDTPRTGIHTRGNRNLIEYNHLHHVNIETNDAAAINLCDRDLTQHDTKIRYNRIHDVFGLRLHDKVWDQAYFTFGIYLDDFSSGVDIHGNLIYRTPSGGIFTHANQDVRVFNNILVDGDTETLFMRRWSKGLEYERLGTHGIAMRRNEYTRNILCSKNPNTCVYKFENCLDMYFELDMVSNEIDGNLIWTYGRPLKVHVSQDLGFERYDRREEDHEYIKALGFDGHSIVADPLFLDPARDDYRLRDDSPAFGLGFKPLPYDKMGPYESPERASWPIIEVSGAALTPVVMENFHNYEGESEEWG